MTTIQSGVSLQHQGVPRNTGLSNLPSSSQLPHSHPDALSHTFLSPNAHRALDQAEAQPDDHHQLLALLAKNGITDNALQLQSHQGANARYRQILTVPGGETANLTIRARLNDQAQYDIVGVDLHVPTSGKTDSIYLAGPPSVVTHDYASVNLAQSRALLPTHLAPHSEVLSRALLSPNAHRALDQAEAQPDEHHQLFALLARNGITDNALQLQSHQGANARYTQKLTVPGGETANLTIRARLNDQAQYDIAGVDLHLPTSGKTDSIYLSGPPAAIARDNESVATVEREASPPIHLSAQYSRYQLTDTILHRNNPHIHSSPPPGASDSTQSTDSSHVSSTVGESTFNSEANRIRTITSSHTDLGFRRLATKASLGSGSTQQVTPRLTATDEQIRARLRNPDGTLRSQRGVANAVRGDELKAGYSRIAFQLQAAGGKRRATLGTQKMQSATNAQIRALIENSNGVLKNRKDISIALHAKGLTASNNHITSMLQSLRGVRRRKGAADEDIMAQLSNSDGTIRTNEEVVTALHKTESGVKNARITELFKKAAARQQPAAKDG